MPTEMEISTSSGSSTTSCTLLDQPVGFKCLASLLGVGGTRLGKKASGNPDLRFGKHAHQSKPGTWTVDGFLQVAYDAIAETLPDEFLSPQIVILFELHGKTLSVCEPSIRSEPISIFSLLFLKHMKPVVNISYGVFLNPFRTKVSLLGEPLHQFQVCPKRKSIT